MKKFILITLVLFVYQGWAQNSFDSKNIKSSEEKDVIYIPALASPRSVKMPLFYNVRTTRAESAMMPYGNNFADTLNSVIMNQRWSVGFGKLTITMQYMTCLKIMIWVTIYLVIT